AHHDHPQAVLTTLEAVLGQKVDDLRGFAQGAHEGHHQLDVGQPHDITDLLHCPALELEAVAEGIADVARRATEAEHRVLFFRLVELAADQVGIFVGLEVRQTHDDLLRPEGRGQGADALDQLLDVEVDRIAVTGNALLDAALHFRRQAVEVQQRLGMHADHAVDDEFEAGQADAFVRQLGEIERTVRVADVHHDLERQFGHGIDGVLANIEAQLTVEDQAGIAFGTGHSDTLAILEQLSGIAATHYRRDTQLTRDDRRVTGTPTTVGDDGASALHHGLPIGVGHVGYEYVAGLHAVHLGDVANDLHRAGA